MINLTSHIYDPLTPQEVQQLWDAAHQGDEKARERLICSTLRPVVSECSRYATKFDLDELISMALVVATEAYETFDPSKGMQFYSYAVVSVRWKIGVELHRNHPDIDYTDDERALERMGGHYTPTDTDIEAYRAERNKDIRDYLLTLPTITPELLFGFLKHIETDGGLPNGWCVKLRAMTRRNTIPPSIHKAIGELIGAATADRVAQDNIKTMEKLMSKATKSITKQQAVENFNMLYEYIIANTDSTPMQAEASAYLTLAGFDTLRAWADRHGIKYKTAKGWRMAVRRKLADLESVDKAIATLDPSLFKS